jgi:hypothetical protein
MKDTRADAGTCKGGISPLQFRTGQLTLIPGPSVMGAILTNVPEAVAFETTLCDGDGGEGDAGAVLLAASEPELDCEELTTYETREVVAVPNSRSMGGV